MKTIGRQQILIIWLQESKSVTRNDRGCSKEAPSYVARWTIFGSLTIVFVVLIMLFLIKKISFSSSEMAEL